MEQLGLDRKALEPSIGSRARVSEVPSGKRNLTLEMIRRLHRQLGIPADVLLES
jgi:HTH-type transcriptional regulator/antitoxin HigA